MRRDLEWDFGLDDDEEIQAVLDWYDDNVKLPASDNIS